MDHLSEMPSEIQFEILSRLDDSCGETTEAIISFVTRALEHHNRQPLSLFTIETEMLTYLPDEMDRWMVTLAKKEVKSLDFSFINQWNVIPLICRSPHLVSLTLKGCSLDGTVIENLDSLRKIHFNHVNFNEEELMKRCKKVSSLTIDGHDSRVLKIADAPSLCEGSMDIIMIVECPRLKSLLVSKTSLESTSQRNFFEVLGNLPSLEKLVGLLGFTKHLRWYSWMKLPLFLNLKTLSLDINFLKAHQVFTIYKIVTISQTLRELKLTGLHMRHDETEGEVDLNDEKPLSLVTVELNEVSGLKNELKLITFILSNSLVLKSLQVKPRDLYIDENKEMVLKLLEFRRASPLAQIFLTL